MKNARNICIVTVWILSGTFAADDLQAAETQTKDVTVHVTTGFKILPNIMWGFIPMPPSIATAVDINRLRIRTDVSYHPFARTVHSTVGAGVLFTPKGKNAPIEGGFQIKLPILLDVGFVKGRPEAGDGYDDDITWVVLGPGVGSDFTWWKAGKLGFTISLKAGYQFRFDVDSEYPGDYSSASDTIGVIDLAVLFGIAI